MVNCSWLHLLQLCFRRFRSQDSVIAGTQLSHLPLHLRFEALSQIQLFVKCYGCLDIIGRNPYVLNSVHWSFNLFSMACFPSFLIAVLNSNIYPFFYLWQFWHCRNCPFFSTQRLATAFPNLAYSASSSFVNSSSCFSAELIFCTKSLPEWISLFHWYPLYLLHRIRALRIRHLCSVRAPSPPKG